LEITTFLLDNGADPYYQTEDGQTIAHFLADRMSADEYRKWEEGMIQLGYKSLFDDSTANLISGIETKRIERLSLSQIEIRYIRNTIVFVAYPSK